MKRDILGERELESIQLDWSDIEPGQMTTRCCGTGTCDNQPILFKANSTQINQCAIILASTEKAKEIMLKYGSLRSV